MSFVKISLLHRLNQGGLRRYMVPCAGSILIAGVITGCGGQSEEPAVVVQGENKTIIENTVEVPVASNTAGKVIVNAPATGTKTTTTSSSTTTTAPAAGAVSRPRVAAAPAKPVAAAGAPAAAPVPKAVTSNAPLVVQAQVVAASKPMKAGEYEGKGYLTFTKYKVLSVEKGSYSKPLIVAAHWGVKDGKPGAAAGYKVGQKVRLELEPFDKYIEKNAEVGALSAADEVSDVDSVPYWAG